MPGVPWNSCHYCVFSGVMTLDICASHACCTLSVVDVQYESVKSTNTKICTIGRPHYTDSWCWYPEENNGRMFGGRKPLGKQRDRWEDALWSYAVNLLQVRDRMAARKREVGGRRSGKPWPQKGLKHQRRWRRKIRWWQITNLISYTFQFAYICWNTGQFASIDMWRRSYNQALWM